MKQYSHDYTKAADAESHLYAAQQLNAHDDPIEGWKHIEDARRLLQEYLAQDNMVPDDDIENGWVRASDAFDDNELNFIRDNLADLPDSIFTRPSVANEALAIINHCQRILLCPEFDSVEQFRNNKSNKWTEIQTCNHN